MSKSKQVCTGRMVTELINIYLHVHRFSSSRYSIAERLLGISGCLSNVRCLRSLKYLRPLNSTILELGSHIFLHHFGVTLEQHHLQAATIGQF